jgi:hypothetical protein
LRGFGAITKIDPATSTPADAVLLNMLGMMINKCLAKMARAPIDGDWF